MLTGLQKLKAETIYPCVFSFYRSLKEFWRAGKNWYQSWNGWDTLSHLIQTVSLGTCCYSILLNYMLYNIAEVWNKILCFCDNKYVILAIQRRYIALLNMHEQWFCRMQSSINKAFINRQPGMQKCMTVLMMVVEAYIPRCHCFGLTSQASQ